MKRFVLAIVLLFLAPVAALAADALDGSYFGIDEAAGASIRIAPDPGGYTGTFSDRNGRSQPFKADRIEDAAEAVLDMDGQTVLMRMVPLPYGAQVTIVPFRKDGKLALEYARSLSFLRKGVKLPDKPETFIPAPQAPGQPIAGNAFVESYQFWEPVGVVNGYLGLPEKIRTLIRMFPAVQLDVIWKLCLAPQGERALSIALRGQDVACNQVVRGIANAQRTNRFDDYKAEVNAERKALQMSVRCADGYVETRATCDAAARRLAQAAVSMRTAGMVLSKYR